MRIHLSDKPLAWGSLDLPLHGLAQDWHSLPLDPPLCFSLAMDAENLWFVAARQSAAECRPGAAPGSFTEGLWEYDVAELFLANPEFGTYLEFNLAPNGAWWAAKFDSIRVRSDAQPAFEDAVSTFSEGFAQEGWCAALSVPLDLLGRELGYSESTLGNVTAILNTPRQTFHTVAKLPGDEPDFHQPAGFLRLSRTRL